MVFPNYEKKRISLLHWNPIQKRGTQAWTYSFLFNGIFLVCFYRCLSGSFFFFLWWSGWKIGLFCLSISFIRIWSSGICSFRFDFCFRKEHRHSKDETWIEDPRLPLRKGPFQPPLMELLNSFPLPYLTHRHRALACQLYQTLALNCQIPSLSFFLAGYRATEELKILKLLIRRRMIHLFLQMLIWQCQLLFQNQSLEFPGRELQFYAWNNWKRNYNLCCILYWCRILLF